MDKMAKSSKTYLDRIVDAIAVRQVDVVVQPACSN